MTSLSLNASEAVNLAVRLCCIGRAVCLAELALTHRERRPGGMLNWEVAGMVCEEAPTRFTRLRSFVWKYTVGMPSSLFTCLQWLDAAVILGLFLFPATVVLRAAAALFLLIEMKRHYFSVDGSDEMMLLCLSATTLGGIGNSSLYVAWFLAAELVLAYTTAGAYKAASPFWQKGKALLAITRTRAFGHPHISKLLNRYPLLAHASELSLLIWESAFIVALIAPRPMLWAILTAGIVFHLSCALVMGLNTFLWAFAASYPCVIFANQQIHSVIKAPLDGYLTAGLSLLLIVGVIFAGRYACSKAENEPVAADNKKQIPAKESREPQPIGRLLPS
jgi:hypothetical protein